MRMRNALHVAAWMTLVAPTVLAARQAIAPHAVSPHTVDWQCAINTSQIVQLDLKDIGLIDPSKVDDNKTEVHLLLKKSFGGGRYEQVYSLVIHQNDGKSVKVIAESTTEAGECPSDHVKVFVVSQELGNWPSHKWVLPPR